jgi:large subunit ribosomal protein L20
MPRVKGGVVTRRRRKKILKLAKGYFGSKHILYKTAHEQVMRSLAYSYRDRKQRKRNFRKLWIARINAACKLNDFKYSLFINGLSQMNVQINRKMLADLAVNDPKAFTELVELAKKGLENKVVAEKVNYVNVNEYVNNFKKKQVK